ncbi:COPII coat assembly protein SEC16 [Parastagonospora nodorum]|nr:COPII coat assembly protein SEC16 [Parastagonospora nodorum]KAH4082930.1 COPII coat assembly protein SEC16 [Parastagonospora nodorum]KAH5480783.1 COPII coat assembly protein SEC16 [Parastagonospora nodorum]KAH5644768.1 COPII coat assembly protein SEC16 [Parastagonospora nodorum]KAH5798287.1 COPII coat assembly protein SEC16 [Parastagonospora nodorum]
MDSDGVSHAPSVAQSAPSWNPALRHEKDHAPAATAKLPSQVKPESSSEEESEEEEEEEDDDEDDEEEEDSDEDDDEEENAPAATAVSGPTPIAVLDGAQDSEDESESPSELTKSTPIVQASQGSMEKRVEVIGAEEEALVNAAQALNISGNPATGQTKAESTDEAESDEDSEEEESSDEEAAAAGEHQADNYEHQGEATALEEAVNESVRVPLVDDAAPESDDWGDSGDPFEIGGLQQELSLQTPHAEAAGTTVGDDVIGNTTVGGNAGDDLDWGNTEEEDFFGVVANKPVESVEPAQPTQSPGAHVVQAQDAAPAKSEWDLDLDLDEDFLPDNEDGPVIELSDDEGFLDDEPTAPVEQPASTGIGGASRYAPQAAQTSHSVASPYAAPGQFANPPQGSMTRSITTPAGGVYNGYGQNVAYQQQQAARPTMPTSAQSYADKSKGGYASPYDLPDDVVTTRKRTTPRPVISATQPAIPPPRTSSMSSSSAPPRPLPPSNASVASLSPPPSGHSMQGQMTGFPPAVPPKSAPPAKAPSSDFFAELPVTSKPKPPGRYTPQPAAAAQSPSLQGPPQFTQKERTASWSSLRNEVLPDTVGAQPHLRQPEQLPMFPSQPSVPTRQNSLPIPQSTAPPPSSRYSPAPPSVPANNARYSPAPPTAQGGANSRYSPAPPGSQGAAHARYVSEPPTGPARTPSQTYAPRTSSPLAFHSTPHHQENTTNVSEQQLPGHHVTQSADGVPRAPFRSPLEGVSEALELDSTSSDRPPTTARSDTPPPTRSSTSSAIGSPRKKGNYTPQYQPMNPMAPSRSLSQSPATGMKQPGPMYGAAPIAASYGTHIQEATTTNSIPHRRQASLNYECIVPEDERAVDPLQRYKGHPVFAWGLGGTIVTTFPKQIPRYGGGMTAPMVKCSPGEIKIQSVKEIIPLAEDLAKFPGPLKAKSKKKDVLSWLTKRLESLELQIKDPNTEHTLSVDELKRLEEKTLLLKLLQFLVENDGRLEGEAANAAFKNLFSPEADNASDAEGSFSTAADIVGRSRSNTVNTPAEPIDARAIEDLQKMLARGEREKAVWHAVDQRLWGHAMLLSSTLSKDIWKQVVQEFVRNEVKKVGRSNQALAVLYEVFAGNHEDCIDELVPASARAGFQMVSTDGAGAALNAQQGLDKWRETIALILNNRSEGDVSALLSLGKLLSQYGRVEAAHICFILGRSVAHVSGVDDALADLVLIGIDHKQHPTELGVDLEPILLTEVYEFALSLSAQVNSHIMPHLQNYKLAHAYQLAEHGYRTEAQAYCDAIAAAMKATTRTSPYYNLSFIASLDDLSKRLSQSPKDSSSSWISKPSMDRVSTSLMSKFNSFIAGEDDGPSSNAATGTEVGPFAKITGDSPGLTPSHSNADLYGAYSGYGVPVQPTASANSRYAPSNTYAPRTSSEQQRSRFEPQGRPSMESNDSHRAMSDSYMPMTPMTPASGPYSPQPQLSPPSQRTQAKMQSYSPLRAEHNVSQPSYGNPYMPTPPNEETASASSFGGYQPQQGTGHSFDDPAPPTSSFDEPSYQPYNPDADDMEEDNKPKKKSIMDDDDDDLVARAAALKIGSGSNSKSDADKKADEAFRKAAEADAKRDKENAAKKAGGGWLSGWFKKDPNAAPGPIKAKLGEESSFYYDPDLGKWVNKKGGSSEPERATATPPPPKGPPMGARSASGGMPPPSGPPPSGAGLMKPPTSAPLRSSSMPPPMGLPGSRSSTPGLPSDNEGGPKPPTLARPSFGAASGPPSRPGTGMSNASSIDDLLGAPQARKGAGAKKKKGGRYVDVFPQGQAS